MIVPSIEKYCWVARLLGDSWREVQQENIHLTQVNNQISYDSHIADTVTIYVYT